MNIENFHHLFHSSDPGVWVDLGDDARVRLSRLGNAHYDQVLRKRVEPYLVAIREEVLDDKVADQIFLEVVAEAIILDWDNIQEKKKIVPYSFKNAVRLLKEYPSFRDFILCESEKLQRTHQKTKKDSVKNLLSA